jgi:hypothetical protein
MFSIRHASMVFLQRGISFCSAAFLWVPLTKTAPPFCLLPVCVVYCIY